MTGGAATTIPPAALRRAHLVTDEVADGVTRLGMWTPLTRLAGMRACCYLVDGVLVDTGFSHARSEVLDALRGRRIRHIVCTHHHEDHTGNAAALSREHGCGVHLRHAGLSRSEGVVDMRAYRRWFWGPLEPFHPVEMVDPLRSGGSTFRPIPTPGHSATHTAYLEGSRRIVFTGDLYVTGGVTAVMSHENPYESIASLRRVARSRPRLMLTGHGRRIDDPTAALLEKADRIERAARRVLRLARDGVPECVIVAAVFRSGHARDRLMQAITGGEFSRTNFVRACLENAPGPPIRSDDGAFSD
jgi:glyoxylase-like metal-dependent hydrolase (beta-lactamase superfamily II)